MIKDLRRGNKINPKLTPKLHYGLSESHFTHEAILDSISANEKYNFKNKKLTSHEKETNNQGQIDN